MSQRRPSTDIHCEALSILHTGSGALGVARQLGRQGGRCAHELFEQEVKKHPDRVAVVCGERRLTYTELNQRANQLAHYLRKLGVGPETRVGLCVDRSIEMLVGLIGIMKAGGVYAPFELGHEIERLRYVIDDAKMAVIVTQESSRHRLPSTWASMVCLDSDASEFVNECSTDPGTLLSDENLVYVIYTSGSTGQPKGVGVEHRHLTNYIHAIAELLEPEPGATFAFVSSIAADLGNTVLYLSLCFGGELHILPADLAMDGSRVSAYFGQHNIDFLKITPSHMKALWSLGGRGVLPRRQLILGGEPLDWELLNQLSAGCRVLNHYGPTECTVGAIAGMVHPPDGRTFGDVPLGKPLRGVCLYLLDSRMQPVPVGVKGELFIGGPAVARGYLNSAGLTAARFLPDPFDGAGGRIYRTGDLAKWRQDGQLDFLGRVDDQVKVRGYRVEPREIEVALLQQPAVEQAVVLAYEDSTRNKQLVAYIVPRAGERLEKNQLRDALGTKLPDYMIPASFVALPSLPLTPTGKINRKRLPKPEPEMSQAAAIEPRDSTEMQIRSLYEQILEKQNIGISDNFFSLGGHSLSAVALAARLSKLYRSNVPVQTVFERPTVLAMAEFMRQNIASVPPVSLVPIQPHGGKCPFFAVHPSGGTVHCYITLSQYLGSDQPFYAFQSRWLDGSQAPLTSVKDMVDLYVDELLAAHPRGPFQLGGWSLGGLLAYEMAHDLARLGKEVRLVALFDSRPNLVPLDLSMTESDLAEAEAEYLVRVLVNCGVSPEKAKQIPNDERLELSLQMQKLPFHLAKSQYHRWVRIGMLNERAARRHRTRHYAGTVILFKSRFSEADEIYPRGLGDAYGWDRLAGRVQICHLEGQHRSFLSDTNAHQLAIQLERFLAGAALD